jgi:hypothetical protein
MEGRGISCSSGFGTPRARGHSWTSSTSTGGFGGIFPRTDERVGFDCIMKDLKTYFLVFLSHFPDYRAIMIF